MVITLKALLFVIFLISFMVFVTFFGRLPVFRRTPIGGLHRLIWIHIPNAALAVDQRLTSGRLTRSLGRLGHFLMNDRHPTVVVIFILIMLLAEIMFMPAAWPHIGWFTKLTTSIAIFLPYFFLYMSCAADPGYITPETHGYYMSLYPYDHAVFHPGRECTTCRHLKPARSKHCSICKRCVAKSDHHCIFINSCVGYGNQHWFLLLLLTTGALTVYGSLLGLSVIGGQINRSYPSWTSWPPPQNMPWKTYFNYWGFGIQRSVRLGATTLLATLISPLVWGLTAYSVYLVYCGVTTNESNKWSDWKEDMKDGCAYRRPLPVERRKNLHIEPQWTRWPKEPRHIMLATSDAQPPPHENTYIPGRGHWEMVRSLDDVDNLYDLGMWNNLRDVFVLDCDFGSVNGAAGSRGRYRKPGKSSLGYPP